MRSRSLGVPASGLFAGLVLAAVFSASPGGPAPWLLSAGVAAVTAATMLLVALRRAERDRARLERLLAEERDRARNARERAWHNALLVHLAEELRALEREDDVWRVAAAFLGRAFGASRVAAWERGDGGACLLRARFTGGGISVLQGGASPPRVHVPPGEIKVLAGSDGGGSLIVVPLPRERGEGAVFEIHHRDARDWDEAERRLVLRLAEHLARVLDRAAASRELSLSAEARSGLLDFARALAAARETAAVAELAVSVGAPLARARQSALVVEVENGGHRILSASGFPAGLGAAILSALQPRLEEAARQRAPLRLDAVGAREGFPGRRALGAVALFPLYDGRELLGVLVFGGEAAEGLDAAAAETVAHLVAAGLRNARLVEGLVSSREVLGALFEESPDAAVAVDELGVVVDCNPAAGRVLGLTREELARTETRLVALLVADSARAWQRLERRLLDGGRIDDQPLKVRSREGGLLDVLATAVAIPGPGPRRARVILRDVSELRRLEHQLRQSQKLEIVGALAGGLAHDFNNVLGGILGYASLLRTMLKDQPLAAKYLETIERSAVRGAELTGRLLAASRKAPARRDPVNLNGVVEETLELLEHSFHKRVRIERRLDPEIHSMLADASQLQQVVLNLCVNARDAMPDGGLLRVTTRRLGPSDRIQLSVEDTGVGMDAMTLARLFEPFFSTKGEAGTGLGLSVVYGIVKSLGGEVGVTSSPGRGARFDVVLPCSWVEASPGEGELEEPSPGRGELILLVDDEKVLRDLGKDILETQGYRVAAVASGEEALRFLRESEERVSLVILDVVMPGLGGDETYRRLRGFDRDVPVLLSSGLTAEESLVDVLRDGSAGFIPKPYGIADLTRAVSLALRRRSATFVH